LQREEEEEEEEEEDEVVFAREVSDRGGGAIDGKTDIYDGPKQGLPSNAI
jgi:hypothetical protein